MTNDDMKYKPTGYSYRVDENVRAGEYPVWEWEQGERMRQLKLFTDFGIECFVPNDITPYKDVHIGEIYDNYPSFDSYDSADNRTYQNYIFRKREISAMDMKSAYDIQHIFNFCKVHENIPEEMLPILYYNGDGKYMLLATAKSC